jgi:hypothetical protein
MRACFVLSALLSPSACHTDPTGPSPKDTSDTSQKDSLPEIAFDGDHPLVSLIADAASLMDLQLEVGGGWPVLDETSPLLHVLDELNEGQAWGREAAVLGLTTSSTRFGAPASGRTSRWAAPMISR